MRQPLLEVDDLRVAVYSERRGLEATKRGATGSGIRLPGDGLELPPGWVRAIHGVSFAVHPGETLALVGESASGKSLIVMGALGLLPAGAITTGGTTRIEGYEAQIPQLAVQREAESLKDRIIRKILPMRPDAVDDPEWRKLMGMRIGVLFQDPIGSWTPDILIGEQTAEVLEEHTDLTRGEIRERVFDALGDVQLPKERKFLSYRFELSRGEGQRAMLAAALIKGPDLLIADEPFSGLDVSVAKAILELIRDMLVQRKMAMVFVSHDLAAVASIADRVGVVYGGRIVEEGPVREVFYRPQHPYTEGLLASIPGLDLERLRPIVGDAPPITDLPSGCSFAPRCEYALDVCRSELPDPSIQGQTIVSCHRSAELTLRGVRD
jgi:oligopeptide/dipeptide ABC transporter ATP-binding protein